MARRRELQERMAELLPRRAEELGVEPPFPMEEIARMTFAMADGVALQKLLDPESVPDDMYPDDARHVLRRREGRGGAGGGARPM